MELKGKKKAQRQKLDFDLHANFGIELLNTNWFFKQLVKLDTGLLKFSSAYGATCITRLLLLVLCFL